MTCVGTNRVGDPEAPGPRLRARQLEAAAWGLFLIWLGVALGTDISMGGALVGVGVITLGGQVARKCSGLRLEGFWVAVGILFAVAGVWEWLEVKLPLWPILLVAAGLALLLSAFARANHRADGVPPRSRG